MDDSSSSHSEGTWCEARVESRGGGTGAGKEGGRAGWGGGGSGSASRHTHQVNEAGEVLLHVVRGEAAHQVERAVELLVRLQKGHSGRVRGDVELAIDARCSKGRVWAAPGRQAASGKRRAKKKEKRREGVGVQRREGPVEGGQGQQREENSGQACVRMCVCVYMRVCVWSRQRPR